MFLRFHYRLPYRLVYQNETSSADLLKQWDISFSVSIKLVSIHLFSRFSLQFLLKLFLNKQMTKIKISNCSFHFNMFCLISNALLLNMYKIIRSMNDLSKHSYIILVHVNKSQYNDRCKY